MIAILRLIFSNYKYVVFASLIFTSMLISLLVISEYLFFEPYIIGHIPKGSEVGFTLIVILSALSAVIIPMNIYRINIIKSSRTKIGGGVFGSIIGSAAGACGCGPIGFAVVSTFGSIGATASTFLTNYELPIRVAAIVFLMFTYYTTVKSLKTECKIKH